MEIVHIIYKDFSYCLYEIKSSSQVLEAWETYHWDRGSDIPGIHPYWFSAFNLDVFRHGSSWMIFTDFPILQPSFLGDFPFATCDF